MHALYLRVYLDVVLFLWIDITPVEIFYGNFDVSSLNA